MSLFSGQINGLVTIQPMATGFCYTSTTTKKRVSQLANPFKFDVFPKGRSASTPALGSSYSLEAIDLNGLRVPENFCFMSATFQNRKFTVVNTVNCPSPP